MKTFLKALLFLSIIGAGVGIFIFLTSTKSEAERKPLSSNITVVEVIEAGSNNERAIVSAMGTVVPAKSVILSPEVGGKIVAQSKKLVPGGRFKKGQIVIRLDPRDYDLVIEQQRARVSRAEMDLAMEQGRKAVAEREWNLIRDEVRPTEEGRKLALREVHLENAQAAVTGAESALGQAKLNLNRTVIRAPFNALVTEELVDVGQVVGPGSRIATLVASDIFWVRVAVPVDRLSWISIPGVRGQEGSSARISQQIGAGQSVVRRGFVTKLLGDLDPVGKMARLLIEVDDPLNADSNGEEGELPLLLGAHVSVEIEGPKLDNMISLPRVALREGDRVWVKDGRKLAIRSVKVVWTKGDQVFVHGDLNPGERVIVSRISAPVIGMKVRLESESGEDAGAETADAEKENQTGQKPADER